MATQSMQLKTPQPEQMSPNLPPDNDAKGVTTCVFLDGKSNQNDQFQFPTTPLPTPLSHPPPPPTTAITATTPTATSVRANSRRNRVYVLREFLLETYPSLAAASYASSSYVSKESHTSYTVLDVAGGRGDLSFLLKNIDGVHPIIADPRIPNYQRLVKSVRFLLDHPEEVEVRAVEGLPTHQPLAKLMPRLVDRYGSGSGDVASVALSLPSNFRIHVDDNLVRTLRAVLCANGEDCRIRIWDDYWTKERNKIESNTVVYGGTAPKRVRQKDINSNTSDDETNIDNERNRITDARTALQTFQSLNLIVGFHPDQATEATIDLALLLKLPFAIVPCCVFPKEFPNRTWEGTRVRAYHEFVEYLCSKHPKVRRGELRFFETDTAKSTVLYMLEDDFL